MLQEHYLSTEISKYVLNTYGMALGVVAFNVELNVIFENDYEASMHNVAIITEN